MDFKKPEKPENTASTEPVSEAEKEPENKDRVVERVIEDEMKQSYLGYAMSVIVGRALPDARDGLKPVHRRILFAMNELGMQHNKPYKKCARIVGEVLGKYHPHGDTAVYDALVRMAQNFSLRYTLVDGQGNFGSIDGDAAAAMRYTEARLSRAAEEMLADIDKETVDFVPNFDGSLKEPSVLPSKLPNLLINGTSGIAVGMATNIPPHNMGEIVNGCVAYIDNPEIEIDGLMKYVKGPDFPTAGIISGTAGIKLAYKTGRGRAVIKSKTKLEEKNGRERIIVTEIPYQVNKSQLIEQIADLVRQKTIQGISDIRDESDREGIRIVIELKKEVSSEIVLNQLNAHTRLMSTFGIIMIALVDNEPKVLNLKQLIENYVKHRQEVVRRRTQFELNKAENRAHILKGLIIALNNIDEVVQKIKKSKDVNVAKEILMRDYNLTEIQAQAILDMKLQKLSSLEQEKLRQEQREILKLIEELKAILADEKKILSIIKQELLELKEKYADERKTAIEEIEGEEEIEIEDLIEEQDMAVTISHKGYVKRLPVDTYRAQGRGGKGVIGAKAIEEDFVENLFIANTHAYMLFFTNEGNVHWLKVYKIPEAGRQAKGKAIVNLLNLKEGEKVAACIPLREFNQNNFLSLITEKGIIKKTDLMAYSRPRQGGIIAINLDEGDNLVTALMTNGDQQILIATQNGAAVKFHERDARPIGRTARGVRAIKLKGNDKVVGAVIAEDEKTLLSVTENGYGKRTAISEYRLINRGGSGVINIQCSERNGRVIAVKSATGEEEVMLISKNGIVIRIPTEKISAIGRNTQGVRLMRLEQGDKVASVAKIVKE